ncbi:MAG: maltooligosyltrehalose trehalohydrolase [Solirubrobacteraceae bacterium]|nr:maltooligosyltrehalose trehalohydrolase [Solirubrobacteraceae bacterium]
MRNDETVPPHAGQFGLAAPGAELPPEMEPRSGAPAALRKRLGATVIAFDRTEFRVWAPDRQRVDLHLFAPHDERIAMTKSDDGYFEAVVSCGEGARYKFVLDEAEERPDPASRLQPLGVHDLSEVVGTDFDWTDDGWTGIALEDYVVYELHIGTFTPEGTFDAVIAHLDGLKELGITVIELLPIAQFPGTRNWGYDGVYVGAAQKSYGGPRGLKRLVDACHARGLALVLDVVYNHLGPEGNYLARFGPYFTDRYKTPWGLALNFDGAQSDFVRWFFIHNALQWIDEFHVDGLRVDAVHAIIDHSAEPFLQDLCAAVHERAEQLGRRVCAIAESDLNDPRVITPKDDFGHGFDSQWSDDFHHSLHVILTGERDGYYSGFSGVNDLARVFTSGYLYVGQHSSYRGRKFGLRPKTSDGAKFVVCAQNHDQIGNRMMGERLAQLVTYDQLRMIAVAVVLSPFIPMLFMGEEYGEKAPFLYFTSHSDDDLIEAVRKGRKEEFDDFTWDGEPPDPHDEETFNRSKLQWERLEIDEHVALRRFYGELLRLRREIPALRSLDLRGVETKVDEERDTLLVRRTAGDDEVIVAFNFSENVQTIDLPWKGEWRPLLGTSLTISPHNFALFRKMD